MVNTISVKESPSNKAPILWALLALSYLFEIGAIAVVINTDKCIQNFAAVATMVFPILMIFIVIIIRWCKEDIFYVSIERLEKLSISGTKNKYVSSRTDNEETKKIVESTK